MKRRLEGINGTFHALPPGVNTLHLVRIESANYSAKFRKPVLDLSLSIVEPASVSKMTITTRISCAPKNLWKLHSLLVEFGYDAELLGREELDTCRLQGLVGVVRIHGKASRQDARVTIDIVAHQSEWPALRAGAE